MTPQETQRMMDFILKSHADAIIRMEKWDERFDKFESKYEKKLERDIEKIRRINAETAAENRASAKAIRELVASMRAHERRMKVLEASDRRTRRRVKNIKDLMRVFDQRLDAR